MGGPDDLLGTFSLSADIEGVFRLYTDPHHVRLDPSSGSTPSFEVVLIGSEGLDDPKELIAATTHGDPVLLRMGETIRLSSTEEAETRIQAIVIVEEDARSRLSVWDSIVLTLPASDARPILSARLGIQTELRSAEQPPYLFAGSLKRGELVRLPYRTRKPPVPLPFDALDGPHWLAIQGLPDVASWSLEIRISDVAPIGSFEHAIDVLSESGHPGRLVLAGSIR